MRLRRGGMVACLLCTVVIAAIEPAAAQSVNKRLIDQLNFQLIYVALPLTLFVEVILIYAVVRFRNNDDPLPTAEDPALEITWTIATAIILLFVGFAAYTVLTSPYITPNQPGDQVNQMAANGTNNSSAPDAVIVEGLAYQWGWQFEYQNSNRTTQDELVIPANSEVYVRMTSADVIHSLFVPELGVKQDVFPSRTTVVHTRVYEPGTYRGYCTEFCGAGHARMRTTVRVLPQDEYQQWLRGNATAEK
ncbi:cytochrome c oxidase subunit 2 [Haladaptatus litoreus]|uniref:cytochrome-c oxidase n=1 Tax=Haladaptatus litoreus TaxID=553468 RepID=A0A1N6X5J5_9EURY|nr:cytochrome c oxidase subunit II [Haladaptatus litoreus]SIQ97501.1 cytochrome c oxidase subunit 2 [Haladaptatus litoreus]